jgi:hypothetical protein
MCIKLVIKKLFHFKLFNFLAISALLLGRTTEFDLYCCIDWCGRVGSRDPWHVVTQSQGEHSCEYFTSLSARGAGLGVAVTCPAL